MRRTLGFESDAPYHILGGGIGQWDWGSSGSGFTDTGDALRDAFAKNPHMRVFVGSGYFDLATPYFATEYTLDHLGLPPSLVGAHHPTLLPGRAHDVHRRRRTGRACGRDVAAFIAEALK